MVNCQTLELWIKTFSAFNWRSVPDKYPRKVQHLNTKRIGLRKFHLVADQYFCQIHQNRSTSHHVYWEGGHHSGGGHWGTQVGPVQVCWWSFIDSQLPSLISNLYLYMFDRAGLSNLLAEFSVKNDKRKMILQWWGWSLWRWRCRRRCWRRLTCRRGWWWRWRRWRRPARPPARDRWCSIWRRWTLNKWRILSLLFIPSFFDNIIFYSSSLYLTKTCWCDEQLVFVWYIPNSGVEHWDSKWITASIHRRGNCSCCIRKVLNSPEGTPAPEPAKPLKTVWKWVWKWEATTLSLFLILIIIGQLPPISSLTRKTVSTCSEDECEEAEADEGDGGLVRVGRILGTFCL